MALVLINESTLKDIGDAIRSKTGLTDMLKPTEMAAAILSIQDETKLEKLKRMTEPYRYSEALDFTGTGLEVLKGYCFMYKETSYGTNKETNSALCSSLNLGEIKSVNALAFYARSTGDIEGSNVEIIGSAAFHSDSTVTQVNCPKINSIGSYSFAYCTSLEKVLGTPKSIGSGAFYNCTSLTSIDLSKLETIPTNTFYNCTSLTEAVLHNALELGNGAFNKCTNLRKVYAPKLKKIGLTSFDECSALETVELPALESSDFRLANCTILEKIILPDSIYNASGILMIDFRGCSRLKKIVIPSSITTLFTASSNSSTYFNGCPLEKIYFKRTTPPAIYSSSYKNAFSTAKNTTVYVPLGCKETYEEAIQNYSSNYSTWTVVEMDIADMPYYDENGHAVWTDEA